MSKRKEFEGLLKSIQSQIANIVPFNLNDKHLIIFDFSRQNKELNAIDLKDTNEFTNYIFGKMKENKTKVAIGRYNEDRVIYARSALFNGDKQPRTIHLGMDIWADAGTPVFAPLNGKVHSFRNNTGFGDYGPTIILEHNINGIVFFTLYGHLSIDSIEHLKIGKKFYNGDTLARIGDSNINGSWPPHIHFQIIMDMQGKSGDFPAVASDENRNEFLELCPDPNLILRINRLQLNVQK